MHSDWEAKFEYCAYTARLLDKIQAIVQESRLYIDLYIIKKAIYYARTYHGAQMRDSGEPFYSHPLEVAYMLADYLPRPDLLATAILHDTIEDTELTKEMIAANFSESIANKVQDLTRIKEYGKISAKEMVDLLWQQNKLDVLLIKLLDRLHNMQTIHAKPAEKIRKIMLETMESFLLAAACFEITDVETKLRHTCYHLLSKHQSADDIFLRQNILFQNDEDNLPRMFQLMPVQDNLSKPVLPLF